MTLRSLHITVLGLLLTGWMSCRPICPEEPVTPPHVDTIEPIDTVPPVEEQLDDTKRDLGYLFDLEALPSVRLTLTAADWNQFLSNFDANPHNSYYVPAAWEFRKNGRTFHRDSVGLRPRGNTSRIRPESSVGEMHRDNARWHHAHFGIKFTEYTTGERFFGCDRLVLKFAKEDPTYCHEAFAYDLMHRFGVWSAPYCSYCRFSIYIQGDEAPVYMGVYLLIENPRKGWLTDRNEEGFLPDKKGNMWKAAWGANLSDAGASMDISDDEGTYTPTYDLKTNKEKLDAAASELRDFISSLTVLPSGSDALQQELERRVDVDLFLRAMAVDVVLGQWDNYWGNQNNYYFYFDKTHRFYYIPFDYDNCLGTGQDAFGNPGTRDPLYWGSRDGDRMLARKVFSIPAYQERFRSYLEQLMTEQELMQPAAAKARVRKFQALVRPYVGNATGEDGEIIDRPAGWGVFGGYRLLSGSTGTGNNAGRWNETNFFDTKARSILGNHL